MQALASDTLDWLPYMESLVLSLIGILSRNIQRSRYSLHEVGMLLRLMRTRLDA